MPGPTLIRTLSVPIDRDVLAGVVADFLRSECQDWRTQFEGRLLQAPQEGEPSAYADHDLIVLGEGPARPPTFRSCWELWGERATGPRIVVMAEQRPSPDIAEFRPPLGDVLVLGVLECVQILRERWQVRVFAVTPGRELLEWISTYLVNLYSQSTVRSGKQTSPRPDDAAPYCPTRPAHRQRWRAIWRVIRLWWESGDSYAEISRKLNDNAGSLKAEPDNVAQIVKAGQAGLLN